MSRGALTTGRIGFDAVRALRNATGLGNYARGVLQGLRQVLPEADFQLYSARAPHPAYADFPAGVGGTLQRPPLALRGPLLREAWRTFRLGRAAANAGVDLYHGLTQEIPRDLVRTGVPSVVTVADLLYHTHPSLFPVIDRRSYAWRYRWSAEHASAVVAISSHTRDQLHEAFDIPLDRIAVIPPARDPRYAIPGTDAERAAVRQRHGLPERFIISVGTLEPRKNQRYAIAAMAHAAPEVPSLVLVGRDGGSEAELRAEIARSGLQHRVHILTDVSREDLPALVQSAALALYLSAAEGFGMPIVEAMSAGLPVVAANGPHLRDAGGTVARYVDPANAPSLAETLAGIVPDAIARALGARGQQHARAFDAAPLARQLAGVYDAVIGRRPLPASTPDPVGSSGVFAEEIAS